MRTNSDVLLATLVAAALATAACSGETAPRAAAETAEPAVEDSRGTEPPDELADYRVALLDLAYEAASAMPMMPHEKNRSRAQEAVVTTCLELDQPELALRYVEGIENWRRGAGYADYAFHQARHGRLDDVETYLTLARQVADAALTEEEQAWRRDRILSKIASTHHWLDRPEAAAPIEAGVEPSELGRIEAVKAMRLSPDDFDSGLAAFGDLLHNGSFDQVNGSLDSCVLLYERFYGDEQRRERVEQELRNAWHKLPTLLRVDVMARLATVAADHGDREKVLALVDETKAYVGENRWVPEHEIPIRARLAGLRFRAGDDEGARAEAGEVLAVYEASRDRVVDIYRPETLRPLAEAYLEGGDRESAHRLYARVVEECVVNPNSRPRAEDLVATLCSMAKHELEPDAELWTRIRELHGALGDPW